MCNPILNRDKFTEKYEFACGVPPVRPMAGAPSIFFRTDSDRNFLSNFSIAPKVNQPFDQGGSQ